MTTPLRRAREQSGETIQQVAAAVGVDSGNLSRIERGVQVPGRELTEKLAKYFDNKVTETQIIYPERFAEPDPLPPPDYTGPERRTGVADPIQLLPRKRASNGV